jgi:hypothetical protein
MAKKTSKALIVKNYKNKKKSCKNKYKKKKIH